MDLFEEIVRMRRAASARAGDDRAHQWLDPSYESSRMLVRDDGSIVERSRRLRRSGSVGCGKEGSKSSSAQDDVQPEPHAEYDPD